jgi:hypothetical protein
MKRVAIYISGILMLISCGQPDKRSVLKNTTNNNLLVKTKTKVISESPEDTIPTITIAEGTVQVSYKSTDTTSKINIINIADYNNQDINPKALGLNWTGLFYTGLFNGKNNSFYIKQTKLKFAPEHSESDEKENEKTGWHVTCNVKDGNMILIKGATDIEEGPVKKALLSTELTKAGQKIDFSYYGVTYTLYTTGFKRHEAIYNYKLFLLAKVKGHTFNQLLYQLSPNVVFGVGGDMSESVKIEFAGDLDGDNIPDFIINASGYSYGITYLYLSKPAGDKAILKLVSSFGTSD